MSKNLKTNLILFVLLPILSIIIGYFGMAIYMKVSDGPSDRLIQFSENVDKLTHKDEEERNSGNKYDDLFSEGSRTSGESSGVTKDVNFSFKGIRVHSIQVGSFSQIANAEGMAKNLMGKGLGSYIYKGSKARVLTEAYLTKEDATSRLAEIKLLVPDAYVVTFEMNDIELDFKATDSEMKDIQEFANDIEKTLETLNRAMVSINIENVHEEIVDICNTELEYFQTLHKKIENKANQGDSSYTYKTMIDCTRRTIATYEELIDQLEKKGQSKAVYWNGIMKTYFQYIDFLEAL